MNTNDINDTTANLTVTTPVATPPDPSAVIAKLVPIYTEINTLIDDAKEILDQAKEQGLPQAMLAKIAKAKANEKIGDLHDSTEALLTLLEDLS